MTTEEQKGYRMLLTMFEISKTMTRRPDRECFNQVVRFLADYARVHPMPKEDYPVAEWPGGIIENAAPAGATPAAHQAL